MIYAIGGHCDYSNERIVPDGQTMPLCIPIEKYNEIKRINELLMEAIKNGDVHIVINQ